MARKEGEAWLASRQKHAFDRAMCVALAAPVGAVVLPAMFLVRTIDDVDPIFRQKRYGDFNAEPFEIIKLRTMPGENRDTRSAGRHDPRASRLGLVLRRTHIDEFPQLSNVWKGDMSFVGPRPLPYLMFEPLMDHLSPSEQKEFMWARHVARPGVVDPYSALTYRYADNCDLRDLALAQIDYAHTATFTKDVQLIESAAHVAFEGLIGIRHPKIVEQS